MEKSKIHSKTAQSPTYAQAANSLVNILKIKEAFPTLPNKKIIEIHNAAFSNPSPKTKNIQSTTKGPSCKQALVLVSTDLANAIMEEANNHVFQINSLLRNIKSSLRAEFICPCPGSISINTNDVPNPSDLTIMECYLKSIEGAKNNKILTFRVINFIRPYLHQFFIDSHVLNGYGKPLKRPFNRYQSHLEEINNG